MAVREFAKQLENLQKELEEAKKRHEQLTLETNKCIYLVRTGQDPGAQERLDQLWVEAERLKKEEEELGVAIFEAEDRLKAAQANQRRVEIRGQQEGLKIKVNEWLKLSKEVERTINRLVNQAKRYNQARAEVFAGAVPLTGRQLGLEKKSTVANFIHLRLSRIDPLNFAWLSEKLARGLFAMDSEVANALINKAEESLRRLDDELIPDLKQHLVDKQTKKQEVAI